MSVNLYLLIWIAVTGLVEGYKEVPSGVYVDDVMLRTQSLPSLKADFHQDVNGGFVFSRCLKWNISAEGSLQKRNFLG